MPSAHCDSNGSSGSGLQTSDFEGVHDFDDVGSLWEHKSDCGQPIHTSTTYVDAFSIYHKTQIKPKRHFSTSIQTKTKYGEPNTLGLIIGIHLTV